MDEQAHIKKTNSAEIEDRGGELVIYPIEPLTLKNSHEYELGYFKSQLSGKRKGIIDCSKLKDYDSYFPLFTSRIERYCIENNMDFELVNLSSKLETFYSAFRVSPKNGNGEQNNKVKDYVENVGSTAINTGSDIKRFIAFVGEFNMKFWRVIFQPSLVRWKEIPFQFMQNGVNAVPITMLIVFLIGVISGYQGARQLAEFGADIYIADLIGISITRELSPIMTAILVAGRSGSAFAAEIGTMKVSEEIDALKSMGFDIMHFLVIPRVLSVMFAMPLLTMLGNIAGVLGGMLAADLALDLNARAYLNEMKYAVLVWDILGGLIKAVVFGMLIAVVGCFRGMQVRGGAESVGRFTTASVVTGILLIIVADAIFTFLYQSLGI